jgi:Raf kinase inhibitor-like YbhB/YbcL family protein
MKFYSPDFSDGQLIPSLFTCESQNISPELKWKDIPEQTKSLVLIVDDPDAPDPKAPKMTWVHWVLYNLPITCTGLKQAVRQDLPTGALEGLNDWNKTGYGGPCPPIGEHRYFFKLYAIDIVLPDLNKPTKQIILNHINGKILAEKEFIGRYQKGL